MKYLTFIFFIFFVSSLSAQIDTIQHIIEGRTNSLEQQKKPYVILISADGFRYDFAKKYKAKNLLALSAQGVSAASMIPSFPSLTFPNHYTIITGLYPSHHGIVSNVFYDAARKETYDMNNKTTVKDGTWYGGTPLWVLAEQQKMLTASFYWVASEAPVKGVLPTYYYHYNEAIPIDKRIQTVVNWLNLPPEKRPHLITFYFPEVDHEAHHFGPESEQTKRAVETLDSSIGKLMTAVTGTGLPVNFVFVSDHGMAPVDTINTLDLPAELDRSKFNIPAETTLVNLYAHNNNDIESTYNMLNLNKKDYKVYLKSQIPEELHYNKNNDKMNRIGDILIIPEYPKVFNLKKKHINPGQHGFNPYTVKNMHASFFAWGPAFKKGINIPSFGNVHVYPLITKLLKLDLKEKIDGKLSVLGGTLKK